MDRNGYCEIVGNNEYFPNLTYSVDIYDSPDRVSVVILAHTMDHFPIGRIRFNIHPSPPNQRRSCHQYLLASERSLKRLNMTLMEIPRIHVDGLRSIQTTGPGGFPVTEYIVSNSSRIWQARSWVELNCPNENGYSIFNIAPATGVLHPRGVCGSIAFIRQRFEECIV